MRILSKPVFFAILGAALAAPAFAAPKGGANGRQGAVQAVYVPGSVRPMYVADRDDHERDRDKRREEAREHRRDRDDQYRGERRNGYYRGDGDRDDDYRNRSHRYGNNYPSNNYPNYRYGNTYPYYGYGNTYPYGYGANGANGSNSSYDRGYRDGVTIGHNDYVRGYGYNPRRYDRRGDSAYRSGFDAGYSASYGRR